MADRGDGIGRRRWRVLALLEERQLQSRIVPVYFFSSAAITGAFASVCYVLYCFDSLAVDLELQLSVEAHKDSDLTVFLRVHDKHKFIVFTPFPSPVQYTHAHMHVYELHTQEVLSKLFYFCPGSFPNVEGLIAPGMHCTYTVQFSPDSLANYQDELKVLVECRTLEGEPERRHNVSDSTLASVCYTVFIQTLTTP